MSKEIMYERIYKDLLTKIMKQEYLPGDKLPTEKELTDEYHVSRITAKKAMDMLAYKEFIKRIPGRGSYVNKSSARIKEDVLAEDKTAQEIMEHNSGKKRVIHVIFDMFWSRAAARHRSSLPETEAEHDVQLYVCGYGCRKGSDHRGAGTRGVRHYTDVRAE